MTRIAIRGGTLVGRETRPGEILIDGGRIVEVGPRVDVTGAEVFDATGCWVGPAFVDLHTHLREPGGEAAETILSGSRAAARGGYSAIVAMPNTEPALDNAALVAHVLEVGRRGPVDVAVAGAITLDRAGERLAPLAEMAACGVRLFSDDGRGVQDPAVMRRALAYARGLGVRLAQHCEDEGLAGDGVMNEGAVSGWLGLSGRPALAEEMMVWRDLELAALTGGALHLQHLSTRRSIEMALLAQARGVNVTFEVTPHHLSLDDTSCSGYDTTFKVHPPLRGRDEVEGLRASLIAGQIQAVAADHAPHTPESKELPFDEAPAGMIGLEHAAGVILEALGADPDPQLFFSVMSRGPARIAQLDREHSVSTRGGHGGWLEVGEDAHLVVVDPAAAWRADRGDLVSRSRNTPYHGRLLRGRVRATIVGGRLVAQEGEVS